MTTFYENYVFLCAKKKKSLSAVAEEIGLSRTSPNGWKKGKQPSEVTLAKLSQYFGVPVSELTSEQKEKPSSQTGEELGESKQKLLNMIDDMSDEELALLFERIKKIKESRI